MKNIIEVIKNLYDQLPNGDHLAEFPDDLSAARNFAVHVREKLSELDIPYTETWDIVEQRNTNVYIKLWAVDVDDYEEFRNENDTLTSEGCIPEGSTTDAGK